MTRTHRQAARWHRAMVTVVAAASLSLTGIVAVTAPAQAAGPTLTATKTTNLSYEGETITVTGTGFEPGRAIWLTACDENEPDLQAACTQTLPYFKPVDVGAGGTFSETLAVRGLLDLGGPTRDCNDPAVSCAIGTAAQSPPSDRSQDSYLSITFAPEGAPQPTLQLSNSAVAVGDTVVVSGSKFPASPADLKVRLCVSATAGAACDEANAVSIPYDGSGTFTTDYPITTTMVGAVTCAKQCVLAVTRTAAGDASYDASAAIVVAKPPVAAPSITLSKSVLRAGDTVRLTGENYPKKPAQLWVSICADPPTATNCNMNLKDIIQITYDGSGDFTTNFKVNSLRFMSGVGTIDCAKIGCVLGTSNVDTRVKDHNVWAKITVVNSSPAAGPPSKAKSVKVKVKGKGKKRTAIVTWTKAKAHGSKVTGYAVQAKKGKKPFQQIGTTKAAKPKLTWTKAKAGNSYGFRVIAKSKAGNSTSKIVKVTIRR